MDEAKRASQEAARGTIDRAAEARRAARAAVLGILLGAVLLGAARRRRSGAGP